MARRANTVSYGNSLENYPHAGQVNSLPICSLAYFPATAMLHIGCHLSSSRGYLAMGKEAVKIGLINETGGIKEAFCKLKSMM